MSSKERAFVFPVRLYNEELIYVTYLSRLTHKPKGTVVREIIRQHKVAAEEGINEKEIKSTSTDGRYEIIVRRKR